MLTFKNVDFSYGNQQIFSDLNFKMDVGEFVFLIGSSGSGKTTFLQLIYMNNLPDSGYVQVNDYSSDTITRKALPFIRRKIGIIFQDFRLLEDRTVYENLSFVLQVIGTKSKLVKRKVYEALTDVGLSHKMNSYPTELSGGEQQRVAIARAIINDPLLILADEPTGNLDPDTTNEIVGILKKINQRGTSIIFATHNYDLVKKNDAKIIKLNSGKAVKVVLKRKPVNQ